MLDIKERYKNEVKPHLTKQFSYKNDLQVPRIVKVVLNMGLGEATSNAKFIENGVKDMVTIAGQKPVINRAKKINRYLQTEKRYAGWSVSHIARQAYVRLFGQTYLYFSAPYPRL
jgi:ribosomal protein L5